MILNFQQSISIIFYTKKIKIQNKYATLYKYSKNHILCYTKILEEYINTEQEELIIVHYKKKSDKISLVELVHVV